jgi:hypothetical protein
MGKDDNQQMVMLPEPIFVNIADADSDGSLEHFITTIQNNNHCLMKDWESTFPIEHVRQPRRTILARYRRTMTRNSTGSRCEMQNHEHVA